MQEIEITDCVFILFLSIFQYGNTHQYVFLYMQRRTIKNKEYTFKGNIRKTLAFKPRKIVLLYSKSL